MSMELRREEREREAEREEAERAREEFARDIRALAERPEGVRFFRWLMDQACLFAEDYEPGWRGAYRAGRKAAALFLWKQFDQHLDAETFLAVTSARPKPAQAEVF